MTVAVVESGNAISARISQGLEDRLGPTRYGLWFDEAARIGVDDDEVRVTVPSRFHADWITRNFLKELTEIATTAVGPNLDLKVEVRPDDFSEASAERRPASSPSSSSPTATPALRRLTPPPRRSRSTLDARYDLDRFVVGPSNALSYRAALRITEGDLSFSPLFVHGACGVGKTHLLQGIARRIESLAPSARIRYVTGEQFTNEYITALRSNQLEKFRQSIRKLDLLALDDVHFLSNKHATQNEFLCTFDAIEMTGARIVLASDEHPKRIEQFHQRLISRFMSGLVVEIQLPDRETRRAIVTRIARERHMSLHPAALEALADRLVGSVREIEGAVTRLKAMALVSSACGETPGSGGNGDIGMILVERLFRDELDETTQIISISRILEVVSRRLRVEQNAILGSSRQKQVVFARSLVAYLSRQLTTRSYPEIARAMGRTNHSTIMAAAGRIERDIRDGVEKRPTPEAEPISVQYLVDQLRAVIVRTPRADR